MNSTLAVCVLLWQLSEGKLSQCDGQITFHMMKGCKMGNSFLLCCYEQITDEGFFIISFSNTSHLQLNPPKLTFRHILAIISTSSNYNIKTTFRESCHPLFCQLLIFRSSFQEFIAKQLNNHRQLPAAVKTLARVSLFVVVIVGCGMSSEAEHAAAACCVTQFCILFFSFLSLEATCRED